MISIIKSINLLNYSILILYLPLLNFLSLITLSRYFGKIGSKLITFFYIFLTLFLSFFFFIKLLFNEFYSLHFNFGSWITSSVNIANWSFSFDSLSLTMSLVVCSISFLVHIYSFNYMDNDPNFIKFLSYLSLFTFFMLVLVFSDNLIVFFLGWEGVGLCSYLLIGFWTTRVQAGKSAIKALFMNRIGDFFIIIATCVILKYFKTTDISTILALSPYFKNVFYDSFFFKVPLLDIISIFLLLGAVGKSAQIGLHTWLPDAMEGPTPVSALIHAATMVTAGIFLIIRMSYLIDFSERTLILMVIFGTLTSFFSGLIALGQWDLKKIVAFSTCSQLGYMLVMCGLSSYALSFYHLFTHAFFKALLFLSSGYIIHLFSGEQDIRRMGSLIHTSPFSYTLIAVASLSLMGFPFLSGFYSKEFILHTFSMKADYNVYFWVFYFFIISSVFLTIAYSLKLIYYTFFSENNFLYKKMFSYTSDSSQHSFWIVFVMYVLGFASVFFGYTFKNLYAPGSNFFSNSIFYSYKDASIYSDFIFFDYDLFIFIVTIFLCFLSFFFVEKMHYNSSVNLIVGGEDANDHKFSQDMFLTEVAFQRLFNYKLYFDIVYNYIAKNTYFLMFFFFELLEKGIFELFGPQGISTSIYYLTRAVNRFHSGYIHHYANIMILSVLIVLSFFFF